MAPSMGVTVSSENVITDVTESPPAVIGSPSCYRLQVQLLQIQVQMLQDPVTLLRGSRDSSTTISVQTG